MSLAVWIALRSNWERKDMTPEAILAEPACVLTQAQREHDFKYGYLCVERLIPRDTFELI